MNERNDGPEEDGAGAWWRTPEPAVSTPRSMFGEESGVSGALVLPASTAVKPPLLDATAEIAALAPREGAPLAIAALAGLIVAGIGGLVWAEVVIATKYDIGILAWLVGAATGAAMAHLAGGSIPVASRLVAGALAAAGIVLGKYVIFVHEVKQLLNDQFGGLGGQVGYLDTRQMSLFVHNLGTIVRPIYALWIALAFVAAFRTAGGGALLGRRR